MIKVEAYLLPPPYAACKKTLKFLLSFYTSSRAAVNQFTPQVCANLYFWLLVADLKIIIYRANSFGLYRVSKFILHPRDNFLVIIFIISSHLQNC
jgi:hypothetical protein